MNEYWRENFGWSVSRQSMWAECKRKYYFNYIGKFEGPRGDFEGMRVKFLSKLKKFVFIEGELIHKAIESQINQHYVGREVSEESAKNLFINELNKIRKRTENCIAEVKNGETIENSKFDEIQEDGLEQLDNFFKIIWPIYKKLKYLNHEHVDSFYIDDIKVWVKADLVTKTDGGTVVITDWKTGKEWGDIKENPQMSTYILWAMDYYDLPLEKIKAEIAYLRTNKIITTERSDKQLEEVRNMIKSKSLEMLNVSSLDELPPDPSESKCKVCNFLTVCKDGKSVVGST